MKSQTIPTPLGHLHVQVGPANGPVMLFWPSLLMSGDMWLDQAAHHAADHQVVLIDPPGQGRSEALQSGFDFPACALSALAVLDAIETTPGQAVFVGNSWGGMMGGTLAAMAPDRLRAAVLMNCTGSPVGWRQRLEFLVLSTIIQRAGRIPRPLERVAIDAFVGPTTRRERPQVIQQIRDELRRVDGRSVHWAIRSVVPERPDQLATLSTIGIPVLVVAGAEDATFPVSETQRMADAIPGARFEVLDGIAHLAGLEDPRRVADLVNKFLHSL